MIILPPPWEGLHPSFPRRPDPFNTNALTNAAIAGGTFGLGWSTLAILFRRAPQTGLKAAAYATTAAAIVGLSAEQLVGKLYARPYLESKGITVPRQKLVTRTLHLDEDSFILAGGIAGILFARTVAKPWQVTGWKRIVGAFSMGAFCGDLTNYAYHWRQIRPSAEKVEQQKAMRAMYAEEMKQYRKNNVAAKYSITLEAGSGSDGDGGSSGKPGQGTSMQQLLKDLQKQAEENLEKLAQTDAHKIDGEDPQPHYSELRDGERVFRPDTNYGWTGTSDALDVHINLLRERREKLKQEAELLWHNMAVKEAQYHATPNKNSDPDETRMTLEVMNHLHINAYLEISQLDWMISSSQKRKLQLDKTKPWVPPPPPNAGSLKPKHTLLLLDELERDNKNNLDELQALKTHTQMVLQDPHLEAVDKFTGLRVEDPYEAGKRDLEELDKGIDEAKVMGDTIDALRRELGGGDK